MSILITFSKLTVVLDAIYLSFNKKKIADAGDIDFKIKKVLQNMACLQVSATKRAPTGERRYCPRRSFARGVYRAGSRRAQNWSTN